VYFVVSALAYVFYVRSYEVSWDVKLEPLEQLENRAEQAPYTRAREGGLALGRGTAWSRDGIIEVLKGFGN
jgi:hypothetical protein